LCGVRSTSHDQAFLDPFQSFLCRRPVRGVLQRGRVNRIILLSDGHANEGITDPSALAEVARRSAQQGIRLSAMGIGQDYNEDLMESLAEYGRGRYHYVAKATDLETILGNELASLKATVAWKTELRIEPGCDGVEVVEAFGYESRREGRVVVVPMSDLFAGDSRRILVSLRVPSNGVGPRSVLRTSLSFEDNPGSSGGDGDETGSEGIRTRRQGGGPSGSRIGRI
jgi:Ca-activated chloride channel homolog